jgi:hypothetical protein
MSFNGKQRNFNVVSTIEFADLLKRRSSWERLLKAHRKIKKVVAIKEQFRPIQQRSETDHSH